MVIKEKAGNLNSFQINKQTIDRLQLEWFETNKRILHKKTNLGREVVMKFLNNNQQLTQGDILYADETTVIVVDIIACDVIIIRPESMLEMANVCYEIGNKHLPLFYEAGDLLVPADAPLFRLLKNNGYTVETGVRKLINPLKTTVTPHAGTNDSLFSKIMQLTSNR